MITKLKKEINDLDYGPVIVASGEYKGRIGIYDDDEDEGLAIVYFGDFLLTNEYCTIPFECLDDKITTQDLLERIKTLHSEICENQNDIEMKNECLNELYLCSNLLSDRYINAIENINEKKEHKIFISHSSKDLLLARAIATDLINDGFSVFLDDWSINLGENIVSHISEAIENSNSLVLIVSNDYLSSVYCTDEWTSFYIRYSKTNKNSIYPILIGDVELPVLLSAIKYARIKETSNYKEAYHQLIKAIKKRIQATES